jgi:hypothetical protein
MKDCRTFLKLQEAVGFKQAEAKSQGYRGATNNTPSTNQPPTNGAHRARDNPTRAIKKMEVISHLKDISRQGSEKHISTSKPGNKLTSSIPRVLTLVRAANRIQQRRPPDNSASAGKRALGTQSSDWRIQHR